MSQDTARNHRRVQCLKDSSTLFRSLLQLGSFPGSLLLLLLQLFCSCCCLFFLRCHAPSPTSPGWTTSRHYAARQENPIYPFRVAQFCTTQRHWQGCSPPKSHGCLVNLTSVAEEATPALHCCQSAGLQQVRAAQAPQEDEQQWGLPALTLPLQAGWLSAVMHQTSAGPTSRCYQYT